MVGVRFRGQETCRGSHPSSRPSSRPQPSSTPAHPAPHLTPATPPPHPPSHPTPLTSLFALLEAAASTPSIYLKNESLGLFGAAPAHCGVALGASDALVKRRGRDGGAAGEEFLPDYLTFGEWKVGNFMALTPSPFFVVNLHLHVLEKPLFLMGICLYGRLFVVFCCPSVYLVIYWRVYFFSFTFSPIFVRGCLQLAIHRWV